jgi:hypothetical protein
MCVSNLQKSYENYQYIQVLYVSRELASLLLNMTFQRWNESS